MDLRTFGYTLAGLAGISLASSFIITSLYSSGLSNYDLFRHNSERALIEEFEGSDALNQLLARQGLKIEYGPSRVTAYTDVRQALDDQCLDYQADICSRFTDIEEQAEAYETEKFDWAHTAGIYLLMPAFILGPIGAAAMAFGAMRKRNPPQAMFKQNTKIRK